MPRHSLYASRLKSTNGDVCFARIPRTRTRAYRMAMRWIPVYSGISRLAFNAFADWCFFGAPPTAVAVLRNGLPIDVDLDDYNGRIVYLFGSTDPKIVRIASALLRAGDVFLDIGANYGTVGISCEAVVRPSGCVHLFEPQSKVASRVRGALRRCTHLRAHLHEVALCDITGLVQLLRPPKHSGAARVVMDPTELTTAVTEVIQGQAIEEYVGPLVEGRQFGAKVDVEGMEPKLVPWLFAQANMKFVIFEANQNREVLWELASDSGLTLFGVERRLWRCRLKRVSSSSDLCRYHDVVAVRLDHRRTASSLSPERLAKVVRDGTCAL